MTALVTKDDVIKTVGKETLWVVSQRMNKLRGELHDSMSISPFLIPILFDLHHAGNFAELGELLLAGHLMVGHTTSFGKLVDEKILPKVFGAYKLDTSYRAANPPLLEACFDEIDHLVMRPGGQRVLLSLKSSRWTIQLTGAIGLNRAFHEILERHPKRFDQVVVGVYNGTQAGLTDKYDILRGINRGKDHDVFDIRNQVQVLAGREFWSWLNGDELDTQDWVLDGILDGLRQANCRAECRELLKGYSDAFNRLYDKHIMPDGSVNWHQLLNQING